jgi:molybdopterin converting factor small subunit
MEVHVKLISTFSKYRENLNNSKAVVKDGDTVEALAKKVGLPLKYVRLVFVNGKQEELDRVLTEGDSVFFLPPAIGGG